MTTKWANMIQTKSGLAVNIKSAKYILISSFISFDYTSFNIPKQNTATCMEILSLLKGKPIGTDIKTRQYAWV